jgi:hypothetical protein
MNINQLLNIGNESAGYEGPKSLLDEMMEEIGFESDIDNTIYEADAAAVTSAASIVENVYAVMAEREAGIEGANPLEAYKGFGLEGALVNYVGQEAITDVVARRAYSGIAQLKSLINTLIAWVSKILGLSANTKKIFKSLAEKAKKVRKDLSKARANFAAKAYKNGEDKEFTREIPDYLGESDPDGTKYGIKTVIKIYEDVKSGLEVLMKDSNFTNGSLVINVNRSTKGIYSSVDNKEQVSEKIKTWKEDSKNEESNDTLFSKITGGLDAVVAAKTDKIDIQKQADKVKKHLEKLRKDMESANKTQNKDISKDHETINEWIKWTTLDATYMNIFAKFYVRVADELFTDAKWLIMKSM